MIVGSIPVKAARQSHNHETDEPANAPNSNAKKSNAEHLDTVFETGVIDTPAKPSHKYDKEEAEPHPDWPLAWGVR